MYNSEIIYQNTHFCCTLKSTNPYIDIIHPKDFHLGLRISKIHFVFQIGLQWL